MPLALQQFLNDTSAIGGGADVWDILISLALSCFLSLVLVFVYRQTHRGISYSVSLVHTMVLIGITVSLIMVVIGNRLAVAFGLVGALSIVRFRTAIKEPRDIAFIFAVITIGMACGLKLYPAAVAFTLFVMPVAYFMHRFKIGSMPTSEMLLKVHLPENLDYRTALREPFFSYLRDHALLSVETVRGGTLLELVYSVHLKPQTVENELLDALRAVNGNNKVVLLTGAQNVDV